jgi:putative endonuclease
MNFLNKRSLVNYYKGLGAEYLTILLLRFKGYRYIERRFKTKLGEVDLIFKKGAYTVFVEVKFRKNREHFLDVIDKRQIFRIKNAAKIYLQKNKLFNSPVRFDVVFVSNPLYFRQIKNAF